MASVEKISLETERLKLTTLDPEADAQELTAVTVDTFDSLHKFVFSAEKPPTVEETLAVLRNVQENIRNGVGFTFGIRLKASNDLIGLCALTKIRSHLCDFIRDQADDPKYSNPWFLGYWIHKNHEGKGYATEAARALMDFGAKLINIDPFVAHIDPQHEKSSGVLKRLGFHFVKTVKIKNIFRSDWAEVLDRDIYVTAIRC